MPDAVHSSREMQWQAQSRTVLLVVCQKIQMRELSRRPSSGTLADAQVGCTGCRVAP